MSARPGRRSRRLKRFAVPAMTPPATTVSMLAFHHGAVSAGRKASRSPWWRRLSGPRIAAAMIAATGMPVTLIAPVVTCPWARALR
ncbi:Uncharacterised protein [Mycobacteroides abscessus subsp. abscessus]|nr:Uncharacterised protein [Mycobacteroides abscessus subsp. abscessus]